MCSHFGVSHHLSVHHARLLALLALLRLLVVFHHHFLLWLLQGIVVLVDNADEVGEASINAASNVEGNDNLLLSGGLQESNTVISSYHVVLLVQEYEVDGGPDSDKGDADNHEQADSEEFCSA